ncbi:hypothetical protein R70723_17470 [Paenibacillus sp. FSL R7-0273]|uniref:DUF4190 domain-containing protein n=1 Tax=Paenibacillus sp. FSL R7-0273 TaxID=1536772 RepID=UPI0004F5F83D|nr:DUF4190 domain-containing protein [Paenibacillus sp. FSL R7-0273]AIQ47473.1 hypothetical protein R70723_17470 [Paenibacillus sp. FSL R7-0273]OMF95964.1 hypothetical protein BK144_05115 [Paenibacillus sp. FSL R7-0273]
MNYQPYGQQQDYYPPPPPPPAQTNGKSIASLVLGILSIVTPYIGLLFGIVAIILSALSLKEIRNRYEGGRGLAIAGLVCGIVGTIIYALLIIFLLLVIFAAVKMNDVETIRTLNFNTNDI